MDIAGEGSRRGGRLLSEKKDNAVQPASVERGSSPTLTSYRRGVKVRTRQADTFNSRNPRRDDRATCILCFRLSCIDQIAIGYRVILPMVLSILFFI